MSRHDGRNNSDENVSLKFIDQTNLLLYSTGKFLNVFGFESCKDHGGFKVTHEFFSYNQSILFLIQAFEMMIQIFRPGFFKYIEESCLVGIAYCNAARETNGVKDLCSLDIVEIPKHSLVYDQISILLQKMKSRGWKIPEDISTTYCQDDTLYFRTRKG